jgi:hypothetical protein
VRSLLAFVAVLLVVGFIPVFTQVDVLHVNPTGVNVNSQGATVVFLTFGNLGNYRPAESCWCGDIVPAMAPDVGLKCDATQVFGCLPDRYNHLTSSGTAAFTDIMSIPPSVARRAYQSAVQGNEARFFYVRHFVSTLPGGHDQYVPVTCRLTGGGARVPFALTDVKLAFADDRPVILLQPGQPVPAARAEITYNGTGRLKGRWEIVKPGEEPPEPHDLLTEATLPIEQRGSQRRYTQLTRFNEFLAPTGKYTLPGPDPSLLPATAEGMYLLLLRVEATDDRESDSNLTVIGAGGGIVHSGAVAGFPLPPLRYFVGSGPKPAASTSGDLTLVLPPEGATAAAGQILDFTWTQQDGAAVYRLEVVDLQNTTLLSAALLQGIGAYRAPSWLRDRAGDGHLRWRVVALDERGKLLAETSWRTLQLGERK